MANIKSQIKRIKTNEKARLRNQAVRSAVRTEIRKTRAAVEAGDKAAAEAQLRVASRTLDKAVSKGVFHRNNAANKKSALAKAVNSIA
ncbi:30S ribosomal protein S20 [Corynebacterium pacaense]|uniref:30S ribosomal protein S20 n=1 Tax=Corynebacterium pacaense TaxID=1816684 RepID=UPI0009BA7A60|nr:30S ribosomal protein S20 [Corynebacterium pacaense]